MGTKTGDVAYFFGPRKVVPLKRKRRRFISENKGPRNPGVRTMTAETTGGTETSGPRTEDPTRRYGTGEGGVAYGVRPLRVVCWNPMTHLILVILLCVLSRLDLAVRGTFCDLFFTIKSFMGD